MSNFLAVDTSSTYLTVLAKCGDRVETNYIENCAMRHSVVLMDEIERTLSAVGMTAKDCDYFAAVTGPGSFTGIRIGISCIKGFATALNKRTVGVTSFDMLAYNVIGDSDFLVAINALHQSFYVCGYRAGGQCDIAPCYLSREEVVSLNRPVYGFEDLDFPLYVKLNPKDCLFKAIIRHKGGDGLCATYVKKSQAEEEREKRGGAV